MTFFHFYLVWQFVLFLLFSFRTKWLSFLQRVGSGIKAALFLFPTFGDESAVIGVQFCELLSYIRFVLKRSFFSKLLTVWVFSLPIYFLWKSFNGADMQKTKFYFGRKQGHFPKFQQKAEKEVLKQRPYFSPFAIWVLSYRRKCSDNFILFSLL